MLESVKECLAMQKSSRMLCRGVTQGDAQGVALGDGFVGAQAGDEAIQGVTLGDDLEGDEGL